MALIPDRFDSKEFAADRLLQRFRAGEIDAAEFGFSLRMVGHHETCYDPQTSVLNNPKLFEQCAARHAAGELTDAEHAVILRYYFGGLNCILTQSDWEHALRSTGWQFRVLWCHGTTWYHHYPVYSCWRGGA